MTFNAFTVRQGLGQGRLRPKNAPIPEGEFAFILGEDESGWQAELSPGDHAEITQLVNLTGTDFLRTRLRLRVPKAVPEGFAWEVSLRVGYEKLASTMGRPGRIRVLRDLAANVSKHDGMHQVSVRLELITTS